VTRHVVQNTSRRSPALAAPSGYAASERIRKRIEEACG
jgi:hypothetical protein